VREAIRELVAMDVLEAQNNKDASVRLVRLSETNPPPLDQTWFPPMKE
jgi:hypothetical protein